MAPEDDQDGIGNLFKDRKLAFLLIVAATAGVFITIYHLITVCFCNRRSLRGSTRFAPPPSAATIGSAEMFSTEELIPAHKYRKSEGLVGSGDAVVCAVCLSEFEEGDELRTLPECLHSFHAPCIDMWLFSHSTCPICRADAAPPPPTMVFRPAEAEQTSLDSRVLEDIAMVQSTRSSA